MSLKPDITQHSEEEMKQLAAGRYQLMLENKFVSEDLISDIKFVANEIMEDVYHLNPEQQLNGEQSLYMQNLIEVLVTLVIKGNKIVRRTIKSEQ